MIILSTWIRFFRIVIVGSREKYSVQQIVFINNLLTNSWLKYLAIVLLGDTPKNRDMFTGKNLV